MPVDCYFVPVPGCRRHTKLDIDICWQDDRPKRKRVRSYWCHTDNLGAIMNDGATTGEVVSGAAGWGCNEDAREGE